MFYLASKTERYAPDENGFIRYVSKKLQQSQFVYLDEYALVSNYTYINGSIAQKVDSLPPAPTPAFLLLGRIPSNTFTHDHDLNDPCSSNPESFR